MKKALSIAVIVAIAGIAVAMQLSNLGIFHTGGSSPLEGMWFGSSGGAAIGWLFQGNMYQLWEGTSMRQSGNYTLSGGTLSLTINETGGSETLTAQFSADGGSMSLTDANGVTVGFQRQQAGGAGAPQPPAPQPLRTPPAPSTPRTPPAPPTPPAPQRDANIEGRWTVRVDGNTHTMVFFSGTYQSLTNGNMEGHGPYSVQGGRLYITPVGKPQVFFNYRLSDDGKILGIDFAEDGTFLFFYKEQ